MGFRWILAIVVFVGFCIPKGFGQNIADTIAKLAAEKSSLSFPGMPGPLTLNPVPIKFGDIYFTGVVSGLAQLQNNTANNDKRLRADLSNAQLFIQKNTGLIRFYMEAGVSSQPDMGIAYIPSNRSPAAFYGYVPLAWLEIAPTDNFSFLIGKLPAYMGAEYTFSFQNINIQRGLLWDQSNSVNRGVQLNYTTGPVFLTVSYNDGFYSGKYNWLSGLVTFTLDSANNITLMGGGSLSRTKISSQATPLYQDNEQGYNIIYTHTSGAFTIEPYLQYTRVPKSALLNTAQNAATYSASVLVDYAVPHSGFSLPFRLEYIKTSGNAAHGAPNLMYGAGSNAWSVTVTPTYQYKRAFIRTEFSHVKAGNITSGQAFGPDGNNDMQSRVLVETGFIF